MQIYYFPDYSSTNPYQTLQYSQLPDNTRVSPGTIFDALDFLLATVKNEPVIFHIHWTAAVTAGLSHYHRSLSKNRFIEALETFVSRGGYIVWTVHNLAPHDLTTDPIDLQLRTEIARLSAKIHVHTESQLKQLSNRLSFDKGKAVVIPHGNYIDYYPNDIQPGEARQQLGIPDDAFVFLFLGQIRPYKGLPELLNAFEDLLTEYSNSFLLIAGNPVWPYKPQEISQLASTIPRVAVYESLVPEADLQTFYGASDIAVLPYRNIFTSGSAIAALSFDTPVIAPTLPFFSDLIENGRNGWLYDAEESDGLLSAMRTAIESRPLNSAASPNSAKDSVECYTWREHAELFQELVVKPSSLTYKCEDGVSIDVNVFPSFERNHDVSVLILIHSASQIRDLLDVVKSVQSSSYQQFHIYIICNHSENPINSAALSAIFPSCTVVDIPVNLGYAGGNNVGISLALNDGNKFLWILNPDMIVESRTLQELIAGANRYSQYDVFGNVITYEHDRRRIWFAGASITEKPYFKVSHAYQGAQYRRDEKNQPYETDYVTGASIFCRTEVFRTVPRFPESYFAYFEETEWCLRAAQSGHRLCVLPNVLSYHKKRSEVDQLPEKFYFYYFIRAFVRFSTDFLSIPIDPTIHGLTTSFINPWIRRIEEIAPQQVNFFTAIANRAISDGLANHSGPTLLNQVLHGAEGFRPTLHSNSVVDGCLDTADSEIIAGWIKDVESPASVLPLNLYINQNLVCTSWARIHREDLKAAGHDMCDYGFHFEVAHYFDSFGDYNVQVKSPSDRSKSFFEKTIHVEKQRYSNTPEYPREQRYQGYFDSVLDGKVFGWARNPLQPSERLRVSLWVDGLLTNTGSASTYREDLATQFNDDGMHAFELDLPGWIRDGERHILAISCEDSPTFLSGSRKYMKLQRATFDAYESYIERIDGDGRLVGWARNSLDLEETCDVEARVNKQVVARGRCTIERRDLRNDAARPLPRYGFSLPIPLHFLDGEEKSVSIFVSGLHLPSKSRSLVFARPQAPIFPESTPVWDELIRILYQKPYLPVVENKYLNVLLSTLFSPETYLANTRMHPVKSGPLVSVIMPTCNRGHAIKRAIVSVCEQSYQNVELVIIDDGSTDETNEVVVKLQDQSNLVDFRIIKFPTNRGVAAARNAGLNAANGVYIAYLDSDNWWHPHYLELMVSVLENSPWASSAYCGQEILQQYDLPGFQKIEKRGIKIGPFNHAAFETANYIDMNIFVHKRDLVENAGNFNEEMTRLVDWEFILRCVANGNVKFVPVIGSYYLFDSLQNQITFKEPHSKNIEIYRKTLIDTHISRQYSTSRNSEIGSLPPAAIIAVALAEVPHSRINKSLAALSKLGTPDAPRHLLVQKQEFLSYEFEFEDIESRCSELGIQYHSVPLHLWDSILAEVIQKVAKQAAHILTIDVRIQLSEAPITALQQVLSHEPNIALVTPRIVRRSPSGTFDDLTFLSSDSGTKANPVLNPLLNESLGLVSVSNVNPRFFLLSSETIEALNPQMWDRADSRGGYQETLSFVIREMLGRHIAVAQNIEVVFAD